MENSSRSFDLHKPHLMSTPKPQPSPNRTYDTSSVSSSKTTLPIQSKSTTIEFRTSDSTRTHTSQILSIDHIVFKHSKKLTLIHQTEKKRKIRDELKKNYFNCYQTYLLYLWLLLFIPITNIYQNADELNLFTIPRKYTRMLEFRYTPA